MLLFLKKNSLIGAKNIKKKMGTYNEEENMKLADLTKAYEKSIINNKIQKVGDGFEAKKEIAMQLGISIATLYRKLEA